MYKNYTKRLIDIAFCLWILPLFLIIFVPVAILIKLDDRGPVFYCSDRLGKNLKKFSMYKFRSMIVNAPDIRNEDGSTYNENSDIRQTRVGKFLRRTSIDEIPQIINVLIGDMSLIGPRPSPLGNTHLYSKEYLKKFSVKPGITGFNQAYYRNNAGVEKKQKGDLYYVENLTFSLDLKIIIKTIETVFKREGLYTNDIYGQNQKM